MAYLPGKPAEATGTKPDVIGLAHSSFLMAASYDPSTFTLTLDFKNMRQDVHRFMYPMTWQQFKEAPSHGSFYSRNIKGKFPTVNFRKPMKVSDFSKLVKSYKKREVKHGTGLE
jgi:hypothetical protein